MLFALSDPISQREVARRAGVQHRSARIALDELVALGLVQRLEGGRDFLVSLNRQHHLAAALGELFRSESLYFIELRRELVERLGAASRRSGVRSVVLFGSVARGEDAPESDLDVLVIAQDEVALERALTRAAEQAAGLRKVYGSRVRAIGYTLAQARRRWRRRQPPVQDAVRDGLVLFGPPLRELLGG